MVQHSYLAALLIAITALSGVILTSQGNYYADSIDRHY